MVNKSLPSRNLRVLVPLVLALTLLAGCGNVAPHGAATPHASATSQPSVPTMLRVLRFAPPEGRVAPFSAQTEDVAEVQRLFATLRALPRFTQPFSCMQDGGGGYLLTFLNGSSVIAVATFSASGCPHIHFSDPYGCHTPTATTMDEIAETLGISPAEVGVAGKFYNTAKPGGPLAPADPSVPPVSFSPCN